MPMATFMTGDAGVSSMTDGHLRDHRPRQGRWQACQTGAMFAPNYIENKLKFLLSTSSEALSASAMTAIMVCRLHQYRCRCSG
jgi:hypothetical protein